MKISQHIYLKKFSYKASLKKISKILDELIKENNSILNSLSKSYNDKFKKSLLLKFKKYDKIQIIGIGGSVLGSKAIYNFLQHKISKKFFFADTIKKDMVRTSIGKKKLNLIISKSGNTLETIVNSNLLIKKSDKNIFITENQNSYLMKVAQKLKAEVIHHNNYIGGRYSVLSEVGMLPAELMGLKSVKFRQFNNLVKNKYFLNSVIENASITLNLIKKKKFNSIILNYDEKSNDLFNWYQQLVAESLGKKGLGILPIVSNLPKDNHSMMQFYLDGFKNNFYTFFFVEEINQNKVNSSKLIETNHYLKNKSLNQILKSQFRATEQVFKNRNIPHRTFVIKKRSEETLGELFTFFILETILLGKSLKINPYDQPAVELIKAETKKNLINS